MSLVGVDGMRIYIAVKAIQRQFGLKLYDASKKYLQNEIAERARNGGLGFECAGGHGVYRTNCRVRVRHYKLGGVMDPFASPWDTHKQHHSSGRTTLYPELYVDQHHNHQYAFAYPPVVPARPRMAVAPPRAVQQGAARPAGLRLTEHRAVDLHPTTTNSHTHVVQLSDPTTCFKTILYSLLLLGLIAGCVFIYVKMSDRDDAADEMTRRLLEAESRCSVRGLGLGLKYDTANQYDDYMKQYGKCDRVRRGVEWLRAHVAVFEENQNMYSRHKSDGVFLSRTVFSDWTSDEQRAILLSEDQLAEGMEGVKTLATEEWDTDGDDDLDLIRQDYRNRSQPVKDQGNCGSCWAFASTGVIEPYLSIYENENVSLSEQFLVDCDPQNHGCDGGFMYKAIDFFSNKGLVTSSQMPYEGDREEDEPKCASPRPLPNLLRGVRRLESNEADMAEWVQDNGPIAVSIFVPPALFSYQGGIIHGHMCRRSEKRGRHAVVIVGYGQERMRGATVRYWLVRNSWGLDWGEDGHFRIERGVGACDIDTNPVVPITRSFDKKIDDDDDY